MDFSDFFPELPLDNLTLVKKSGEIAGNIKGNVQKNEIYTDDISYDIDKGDRLIRMLPNSKQEYFEVSSCEFVRGMLEIPDHYIIHYDRDIKSRNCVSNYGNNISISAPNAEKIFVGSIDNSISNDTYNSNNTYCIPLYEQLRQVASQIPNNQLIITAINEMEKAHNTPSFKDKYLEFMQAAANHVTVFAPFMATLLSFLN